ncbi:MAG TPA: N-acetylmuramoyl-L-alanine amidase [Vicinamibacterales bacterium]|nr:N-acetylmuramoyl-L-alanine amidase [Vicinamibacterales bacterium]
MPIVRFISVCLLLGGLAATTAPVLPAQQPPAQNVYTVYTADGRRSLPYRSSGGTELVAIDQLASLFNFTTAEDAALNALTITARGQRINLIAGQAFAQVSGRIVQLSGPVQRDRNTWAVPVDFLSAALGPALGVRIEVRRTGRVILVGDARVPQVSVRFERAASSGRLTIDIQPPTPHRVTREGNRVLVRFDAAALDSRGAVGLAPEFVTAARVEGTTLVFELGPSAVSYQTAADRDPTQLVIDLMPTQTPPVTPNPAAQEPPVLDLQPPGTIRTIVIDPGHGGDDEGAHGPKGLKEKDLTLQVAQKLKATIESRLGLRVLLTRDGDENVPYDRRTALANNNKADVFFSLHANASLRPAVRGAQVLSLAVGGYAGRMGAPSGRGAAVPAVEGGTRTIEAVPWDLAQLPFASRSGALGSVLVRHLAERRVPLHAKPAAQMPLRVLVGANMPALLIEMGFLTNADDERALARREFQSAIIEALMATIGEARRGIPDPDARPPQR